VVVRLIKIIVFGDPVPKARARTVRLKNGQSVSYTPEKTASWEDSIRMQALTHRPEKLLDGPLALEATFYRIKPPSKPKKCFYPDTKPDLDNLCKSVTDALEGLYIPMTAGLLTRYLENGTEIRLG